MRRAIAILMLLIGSVASAQQGGFISLGTYAGMKVYVANGAYANRVGSAVLTNVHHIGTDYATSFQYLIACDATWVSDPIRYSYYPDGSAAPLAVEVKARTSEKVYPLDVPTLYEWQASDALFISALKPYVRTLCKSAAPEPKNVTIPVSDYSEDAKSPGGTSAILTGTVQRKGDVIDAWVRTTHYRLEPTFIKDVPYVVDGVPQKHREASGTYSLERAAFDCTARQIFTYQVLDYTKEGTVTSQWSVPREPLKYKGAVPGSIGESQLEGLCKIYGGKPFVAQ